MSTVLCGICGTVKRKIVYFPTPHDPALITQPSRDHWLCQGCDLTPAPPQHPTPQPEGA